jgi:hypothetical protein
MEEPELQIFSFDKESMKYNQVRGRVIFRKNDNSVLLYYELRR